MASSVNNNESVGLLSGQPSQDGARRRRVWTVLGLGLLFAGICSIVVVFTLRSSQYKHNSNKDDSGRLPVHDVNLLLITDTHSWVNGHQHTPDITADYSDLLSLHEHLRDYVRDTKQQAYLFLNNGDLNDGTGLSGYIKPSTTHILPIVRHMPFDAINCGNHELYDNASIADLVDSGFIKSWNGAYLTANIMLGPNQTLGHPYKRVQLADVGKPDATGHLLIFGFLYNMQGTAPAVTVELVQNVVKSSWFINAIKGSMADDLAAIIVLAHMHYVDPLVTVLRDAIRNISATDRLPIIFLTGHSHLRRFQQLDDFAISLEAGKYMDTIGYVSFDIPKATDLVLNFVNYTITPNRTTFARMAGLKDTKTFDTKNGTALREQITKVYAQLGLSRVVGCSNATYSYLADVSQNNSLAALYIDQVAPNTVMQHVPNISTAKPFLIHSAGTLRYDLFQGNITVNDLATLSPFADNYHYTLQAYSGQVLNEAIDVSAELVYPWPLDKQTDYHVMTLSFDWPGINATLFKANLNPTWGIVPNYNSTSVFIDYFDNNPAWAC
ncbi:uncharacterized protein MONBRDRAFT_38537 [Monosiga brevicollis MX1]|uniref:Putative 5'-nucleotidase C-terminal domain-containing protein n=1 Tax=Monosiga brevicollis TaxID=81824 RepID=A9V8K8_MONBE|nr:uncharacterized protein MONBRDRAFT_38537 [Monosiga brevicollis MX1]EDQ86162.1 predicted protein [Monosiga brevicollis MX1]|eukprot:XP_001749087.1 hypothetical protein [Monosiga brevicollis MX1]